MNNKLIKKIKQAIKRHIGMKLYAQVADVIIEEILTLITQEKKLNKDFCVAINCYYLQDREGVIWQVIKTPYKKLPIFNLDLSKSPKTRKESK